MERIGESVYCSDSEVERDAPEAEYYKDVSFVWQPISDMLKRTCKVREWIPNSLQVPARMSRPLPSNHEE